MITVDGNLQPYCEGCPYLELIKIEALNLVLHRKFYDCEHSKLCARLYSHISEHTTIATTDE